MRFATIDKKKNEREKTFSMAQPFSPTLKERKRYVVYEPADDTAITQALKELFGVRGLAQAGIIPVEQRGERSLVRVAHTSVDELKAALVMSGKQSIHTSGTLKQARKHLEA